MRVTFRYALAVPADDEKRAKALLELPQKVIEQDDDIADLTAEDEDQASCELPEAEYVPEDDHKRDKYLDPWCPEDATVEVWTQAASSGSDGIEMALKENRIRSRVEVQDDGSRKYFVLPEDEPEACEIVREIVEGLLPP